MNLVVQLLDKKFRTVHIAKSVLLNKINNVCDVFIISAPGARVAKSQLSEQVIQEAT